MKYYGGLYARNDKYFKSVMNVCIWWKELFVVNNFDPMTSKMIQLQL